MFSYGGESQCTNWVHIYEKTLPGLGGASVVDGGLADSGAVLAHEIGHQLVRAATAGVVVVGLLAQCISAINRIETVRY